jgi:hypothetical protein
MDGFIYIIKPTTVKEDLVKVGRSNNLNLSRLLQYGKTSRVYLTINVYNSKNIEKQILKELKLKYEVEKNEYFRYNDINLFINEVLEIIKQNNKYELKDTNSNEEKPYIKESINTIIFNEYYEKYNNIIKYKGKLFNKKTLKNITEKDLIEELKKMDNSILTKIDNKNKLNKLYEYFEIHKLEENDMNILQEIELKKFLIENYEYSSNKKDYIQLKKLKQIVKNFNLEFKKEKIIKVVEDIFENVKFRIKTYYDKKQVRSCFQYLIKK